MMPSKFSILNIFRPLQLSVSLILLTLSCLSSYADNAVEINSVSETFTPATTNVFRRHEAPAEEMFNFYGKVLGFTHHATYAAGNGGVSNFRVGESLLKFTYREAEWEYHKGEIKDVTGLRLLTFFFPSQVELRQSFIKYDFEPPEFKEVLGRVFALIQDPDGQWVELVIKADQPDSFYTQVEIGLTVSNIEASRVFYQDFIGLEYLGSSADHLFPSERFQFRRGALTITLRSRAESTNKQLMDTGSGGIQYVVTDAHAVEALARTRKVQIDKPTYVLEAFNMNFLWLADPDGIINYFAQTGAD